MADSVLRYWRIKAHNAIDPLWKDGIMSRQEVYDMLKTQFGKTIHIGESDIEICKRIIEFAQPINA